jgi:hypothetical protein
MNYIVNSRPQGQLGNLPAFAHRVNQMRSEGLFRGQVVGPLGVEVKVRKSINGQPVAPNWVANLEQVRQAGDEGAVGRGEAQEGG